MIYSDYDPAHVFWDADIPDEDMEGLEEMYAQFICAYLLKYGDNQIPLKSAMDLWQEISNYITAAGPIATNYIEISYRPIVGDEQTLVRISEKGMALLKRKTNE